MKKNIDLVIDGIAPEKVMYDTDNHSLVVLYPAQKEFKRGDILSSLNYEYAMCIYKDKSPTRTGNISTYLGIDNGGRLLPGISNSWGAEATYRHATEEEKQTLFDALARDGKRWNAKTLQVEDLDISEIVVDLETACEYLNRSIPRNYIYDAETKSEKQINAQIEFQMIREAWNKFDGFEVDWDDYGQAKYYPVLDFNGSIKYYTLSNSKHISASCYSFPTPERALQFGNQFKELFKTAMGL